MGSVLCPLHVRNSDRLDSRKEQNHANEADPRDSNNVDGSAPTTKRERAFNELDFVLVYLVSEYDSDIGEIQGWRCDVENGYNSLG